MMRNLYFGSTVLFWLAVIAIWTAGALSPPSAPLASAKDESYTLAEVAKHNRAEDCWMAIDGKVYDLTQYLPYHPTALVVISTACGTDASEAYRTKNLGRPHSRMADELLMKYKIGILTK